MAKNINIVALNKHIAYLTEENQRLRAANDLLDRQRVQAVDDLKRARQRIYDLESQVLHMPRNKPEDRSGVVRGGSFETVLPGGWDVVRVGPLGDAVVKPKLPAEPVVIEAHGLRIKVEKL